MLSFLLLLSFTLSVLLALILITEAFEFGRPVQLSHMAAMTAFVLVFIATRLVWRTATFSGTDFAGLARRQGVTLIEKRLGAPIQYFGKLRFLYGRMGDTRVVAKIAFPFFGYFPGHGSRRDDGFSVEQESRDRGLGAGSIQRSRNLWKEIQSRIPRGGPGPGCKESRVDFFSPRTCGQDLHIAVRIDAVNKIIPSTNIAEVDDLLQQELSGADNFHARLTLDQQALHLTILGGSWEGRVFEQRILRGFDLFRKLDEILKRTCPGKDWSNRELNWDWSKGDFILEETG